MSHTKPVDVPRSMQTLEKLWAPSSTPERGCTLAQLLIQRDALRQSLHRLETIKPCCLSCEQFDLGACKLHGEIPVEFQKVEGECPDWRYDAIPF